MDSVGDMVNQGLIVKVNGKYDAVRFLVPLIQLWVNESFWIDGHYHIDLFLVADSQQLLHHESYTLEWMN